MLESQIPLKRGGHPPFPAASNTRGSVYSSMIAGGGLWFNRQQRDREVEIADRRAQDEALQAYLEQIGQLLLDKDRPLRQSKEGDEVRMLTRARTLTVYRAY